MVLLVRRVLLLQVRLVAVLVVGGEVIPLRRCKSRQIPASSILLPSTIVSLVRQIPGTNARLQTPQVRVHLVIQKPGMLRGFVDGEAFPNLDHQQVLYQIHGVLRNLRPRL
jgi:hypothetical protein